MDAVFSGETGFGRDSGNGFWFEVGFGIEEITNSVAIEQVDVGTWFEGQF